MKTSSTIELTEGETTALFAFLGEAVKIGDAFLRHLLEREDARDDVRYERDENRRHDDEDRARWAEQEQEERRERRETERHETPPPVETPRYTPPPEPRTADRRDVREDYHAPAEDRGQHDTWKRAAYLVLYRYLHPDAPIVPADFATGTETVPVRLAPIFPLELGLADACRRLGFRRVFLAAAGATCPAGQEVAPGLPAWFGAQVTEEDLSACHGFAVHAAESEADAVMDRNAANRANRPELVPVLQHPEREEIVALYAPGAWERPDLDSCPPLSPLSLLSSTPRL